MNDFKLVEKLTEKTLDETIRWRTEGNDAYSFRLVADISCVRIELMQVPQLGDLRLLIGNAKEYDKKWVLEHSCIAPLYDAAHMSIKGINFGEREKVVEWIESAT